MEDKPPETRTPEQLEVALDAAAEQTRHLVKRLVEAEEDLRTVKGLLEALVRAWRAGEDMGQALAQIEYTLRLLQRVN